MVISEGFKRLEIRVTGYQFPELVDDTADDNWLMVHLRLQVGPLVFDCTEPALETFDVVAVSHWLSLCAEKHRLLKDWLEAAPLTTRQFFTEPNLSLEVLWGGGGQPGGDRCRLRCYLSHEFLPPFAAELSHAPAEDGIHEVWIDFSCTESDLRRLAQEWAAKSTRFPTRSKR